jgi:hypothetical protein
MAERIEAASFDEALKDLVGYYDQICVPMRGPAKRLRVRLARYRLSWLAAPWVLVETIWGFLGAAQEMRAYESAARQASASYQLLTGKEPEVAGDEVTEMASQLAEIDGRFIPDWGLADPPFADESQLRVAAAALLRFFAGNEVTDDALFAATQAAYQRLESIRERAEGVDEITDGSVRHRRLQELEDDEDEAQDELIRSWRSWFELGSHV